MKPAPSGSSHHPTGGYPTGRTVSPPARQIVTLWHRAGRSVIHSWGQLNAAGTPTPWRFVLLNLVSFVALCLAAFSRNHAFLFYGLDGSYMKLLVKEQWTWKGLEFGFSDNFFQSLGNVWFPLNTPIIPGYLVSALGHGGIIEPVTSYTVFALELFVAALVVSRCANLTWIIAIASAWLLPLIAFPFIALPAVYPVMALIPHMGTAIAVNVAIVLLYFEVGKHSVLNAAWLTAGIVSLCLYFALSQPTFMLLMGPVLVTFGLIALVSSSARSEVRVKLLCTATIMFTLVLTGTVQYVYGLLKYTAVRFFPEDFFNDRMQLAYASILFHRGWSRGLLILGCLGALTVSIVGDHRGKAFARATLLSAAGILGFGIVTARLDFWRGPSAIYFEFFLWPFLAVFAIAFLYLAGFVALGFLMRIRSMKTPVVMTWNAQRRLLWLAAIVAWPAIFAHARARDSTPYQSYPPPRTAIVEFLEREIGLAPGREFRGRAVTLTGQNIAQSVNWLDLNVLDYRIVQRLGNEHRMVGLWYHDIPTLFEYNSLLTPAFHQFTKTFFSLPGDTQMRSVMTLRRPEERILRAIGVRFVITDRNLGSGDFRIKIPMADLGDLYLFELSSPNVGQYSPTKAVWSASARDTIAVLSRGDFDVTEQIVADSPLPTNLVPAKSARLRVVPGGIRVSSLSEGTSILLLPMEYSRCLSLTSMAESAVAPRLFRANLLQTGILFDRKLDALIQYFTGPLHNSLCRMQDAGDYTRLLVGRRN